MINNSELEEEQSIHYSHQGSNKYHKIFRKCTMCNKPNMLIRLPDELQEHSKKKKMESWFCVSCLQVVNFLL
jgi:cell fate regulator YaaT (PSP1 superfamily)